MIPRAVLGYLAGSHGRDCLPSRPSPLDSSLLDDGNTCWRRILWNREDNEVPDERLKGVKSFHMLLLVRHADAGDKLVWRGPDSLRPLSLAGRAEAAGLVVRLEDYPIRRMLTSPALRCHQTLQPLARDCRLRIELDVRFGVDADLAPVLALLEDLRSRDAVVCTHGEVIEQVLTRLVGDGLMVDQPLEWPKGSTWLLDGANGRITHARYLPPLPWA